MQNNTVAYCPSGIARFAVCALFILTILNGCSGSRSWWLTVKNSTIKRYDSVSVSIGFDTLPTVEHRAGVLIPNQHSRISMNTTSLPTKGIVKLANKGEPQDAKELTFQIDPALWKEIRYGSELIIEFLDDGTVKVYVPKRP